MRYLSSVSSPYGLFQCVLSPCAVSQHELSQLVLSQCIPSQGEPSRGVRFEGVHSGVYFQAILCAPDPFSIFHVHHPVEPVFLCQSVVLPDSSTAPRTSFRFALLYGVFLFLLVRILEDECSSRRGSEDLRKPELEFV